MPKITLFIFLLLLIPDLYIYLVYIVRNVKKRWIGALYWLPSIILLIAYTYYMYGAGINPMSIHTQAIGILAVGLILFSLPKIAFMVCSLIGLLFRSSSKKTFYIFTSLGVVIGLICFGGILYGSTIGIKRFQIKEVEYYSPNLPKAFDGYRITQISDIHIGSWRGKEKALRKIIEQINAEKSDLIVFTGDLVNQRSSELNGFQDILSQLQAPDGVYSILGNHDYGSYYHWKNRKEQIENIDYLVRQEKAMGWKLLNNEHDILHHKGDSIALIGVENDGEPPFSHFANLKKAATGTQGLFRILLSHNPTHWRREVLPDTDIELMLAGHTHAMQLILFGHSPSSLFYPEWGGMYAARNQQSLYVNIGIGYVGLPFRFGAWPEITVIKLKSTTDRQLSK